MPTCYAKGCRNSSSHGVKLSFFPKNPKRRALWINQCKLFKATTFMLPNNYSALCEYHFPPEMWEKPRVDGKKKLKITAVPTIFGDSVEQVVEKGKLQTENKNAPSKIFDPNTIVVRSTPHTTGIQILALPGQQYKMLLGNGSTNQPDKPEITPDSSKDSDVKQIRELPTFARKNTSLHLNSNGITSFIKEETAENTKNPINANDHISKEETPKDSRNSINANDHISNGNLHADDDSDTDSFIDKNFEPISDEEITANEEYHENDFEPITIDDSDEENQVELSTADKNLKANIIADEYSLYFSLRQLDKPASETGTQCKRCEKLEKVCIKSERIRNMMRKNNKQTYRVLKRKIKSLEKKIEILENISRYEGLRKILNEDQIDYLGSTTKKMQKWSEETIEKALEYKNKLGMKGYRLLLNYNWPLPSLKTLRTKEEEQKEMERRRLQNEIIIDSLG